jgi:uncharacterized protein (TIGR00297 family)
VPREENPALAWQSKAILLIVVPWTALDVLFQTYSWARNAPVVAWTTLGISTAFGLIVWLMRAGTPAAAATGAAITASLMYATVRYPYTTSWLHGGLMPLLAVFLLTYAATKIGKNRKEKLGTGENKRGRNAAQVAANLGVAAMAAQIFVVFDPGTYTPPDTKLVVLGIALAALAEAAADTISSEIGQVFGGQPRMLTTLRPVEPGVDGGVTPAGTLAGMLGAAIVALVGCWPFFGDLIFRDQSFWRLLSAVTLAATFGLLFDSLLGATLERKGWLNNDAVNFLSTLSAYLVMVPLFIALFPHSNM